MLDVGFPPYDAEAALRMGDNSRAAEIQQAAKEISEAKSSYLKMAYQGEICHRLRILHVAFVSGMSDAEFRVLWGYLMHGNRDGGGITVGHKRMALLIDKSERAVRRATKDLEDAGWIKAAKHQRKDASRSAVIPDKMMNAILFEVVERSNSSGQRIEVPRLTPPQTLDRPKTVDRSEPAGQEVALTGQNASFRPDKSGNITIIDNHRVVVVAPERANGEDCIEEFDLDGYHEVFNSWGIKPAQREMNRKSGFDLPRSRTDPTFIGAVRAQMGAGHPSSIVMLAARNTIMSMQARIALQDTQPGGRTGVQSYFQKEMDGNIRFLLRQDAEQQSAAPPPQVARGSPPPGNRRDEQKQVSKQVTEDSRRVFAEVAREQGKVR